MQRMNAVALALASVIIATAGGYAASSLASSAGGEAPDASIRLAQFWPGGPTAQGGPMGGPPPHPFGGFGPPGSPRPPISPRAVCEMKNNGEAAIRAVLRSRLKLDQGQREAWAKMEALVEPFDLKARELCETLPATPAEPTAPDLLRLTEQALTLRLDMVKAIQEPFRGFYGTLTAEQRTVIDRPPGPPMP